MHPKEQLPIIWLHPFLCHLKVIMPTTPSFLNHCSSLLSYHIEGKLITGFRRSPDSIASSVDKVFDVCPLDSEKRYAKALEDQTHTETYSSYESIFEDIRWKNCDRQATTQIKLTAVVLFFHTRYFDGKESNAMGRGRSSSTLISCFILFLGLLVLFLPLCHTPKQLGEE